MGSLSRRFCSTAVAVGVVTGGVVFGTGAAGAAVVGPGTPIIFASPGADPMVDYHGGCTVNSTGVDQNGDQYFITAGHCTEVAGDRAYVVTTDGLVGIGETNYTTKTPRGDDGLIDWGGDDFAVVALDGADSTGRENVVTSRAETTTMVSGFVDHPSIPGQVTYGNGGSGVRQGQLVWKDGSSTGRMPGVVVSTVDDEDGNYFRILSPTIPGDSGGAVYDAATGEMLGISSRDESIGGEGGGGALASVRLSAHDEGNAVDQWESETGNQWSYAGDNGYSDRQYRSPYWVEAEQVRTMFSDAADELGDALHDRFGDYGL